MSEAIREILKENPKLNAKETIEAILAKHPGAIINSGSFSVAYYTTRKKFGIGSSKKRGRKFAKRVGRPAAAAKTTSSSVANHSVDLAMIQATAKFLSSVGGAEAALEAIKFVPAAQVKVD
jgi:hypothetical protein